MSKICLIIIKDAVVIDTTDVMILLHLISMYKKPFTNYICDFVFLFGGNSHDNLLVDWLAKNSFDHIVF